MPSGRGTRLEQHVCHEHQRTLLPGHLSNKQLEEWSALLASLARSAPCSVEALVDSGGDVLITAHVDMSAMHSVAHLTESPRQNDVENARNCQTCQGLC